MQRERGLAGQWRKIIPEWNVGRIQWKDDSGQQESGDNRSDYFETVILPSPSLFQERDRRVWGVKQDEQDLGADGPEHAGEDSEPDQVELVWSSVGQDSESAADHDSDEICEADGGSSHSWLFPIKKFSKKFYFAFEESWRKAN